MPAFEIKKAKIIFNKGTVNEQTGLNDLSLSLEPGEFVTIIGSNGAGKTTLFHCISGVYEPDAGRVYINGRDVTYMPEHRRAALIGRIFQDPMKGTAPDMTIEENLSLAYFRRRRNPLASGIQKGSSAMFRERLAGFGMGLEDRMKTKIGLLSGGQRQAVSLLMAVIGSPGLLLLDEHTAALDPQAAEKVMEVTKQVVHENKLATMMITHNLQAALKTGTRTVMLDAGQVILDLSGEERKNTTVPDLMCMYSQKQNKEMDNDRMLLADREGV
jgi:putative ABC transport system ATP-binding protein